MTKAIIKYLILTCLLFNCGYFDPEYTASKNPPVEVQVILNEETVDHEITEDEVVDTAEEEPIEEDGLEEEPEFEDDRDTTAGSYIPSPDARLKHRTGEQINVCASEAYYLKNRVSSSAGSKYLHHVADAYGAHDKWQNDFADSCCTRYVSSASRRRPYRYGCYSNCSLQRFKAELAKCEELLNNFKDDCNSFDHPEGQHSFSYISYKQGGFRVVADHAAWLCDGQYTESWYSQYQCKTQNRYYCKWCGLSATLTADLQEDGQCM